ncbi:MAG: MFS transporter [Cellulomonadaceae bacterium]
MGQLVPVQVLLPLQIAQQHESDQWLASLVYFGIVTAIAGAASIVTYPIVGALSDRTVSRFGRRRPWILAGVIMIATGLALLGLQQGVVGTVVFWTTTMVGFCIASAALTAVLADQVPEGQRGLVSGWISAPERPRHPDRNGARDGGVYHDVLGLSRPRRGRDRLRDAVPASHERHPAHSRGGCDAASCHAEIHRELAVGEPAPVPRLRMDDHQPRAHQLRQRDRDDDAAVLLHV